MGPGSGLGIVPGIELVVGLETGPGRVLGPVVEPGLGPGEGSGTEPVTGSAVDPGVELPHDPLDKRKFLFCRRLHFPMLQRNYYLTLITHIILNKY